MESGALGMVWGALLSMLTNGMVDSPLLNVHLLVHQDIL